MADQKDISRYSENAAHRSAANGKTQPVDQRRLVRPAWMLGDAANDWPEDSPHENGGYYNKCVCCACDFIGHKRRHVCRKCHYKAKEQYDAMTPGEQAAHDAKRDAAITEYFSRTNSKLSHLTSNNHPAQP